MNPPVYSPEFEAMWNATDKHGSKSDAQKAWVAVGSPPASVIGPARSAWLAFWNGIGVKHLATWLRAYDWRQAPAAPRSNNTAPTTATNTSSLEAYCDWHRDVRNDDRPNLFRPKDTCPRCKHLKAASRPKADGDTQLALGGRQ